MQQHLVTMLTNDAASQAALFFNIRCKLEDAFKGPPILTVRVKRLDLVYVLKAKIAWMLQHTSEAASSPEALEIIFRGVVLKDMSPLDSLGIHEKGCT